MGVTRQKWAKVQYSRNQIIKAGKLIRKDNKDITFNETIEAIQVIDNWRAAHAYPLHVFYIHIKRMASGKRNVIVAQRLKRWESIVEKLRREPHMSLWLMQDLGGCRMVVPSIDDVYTYVNKLKSSKIRSIFYKENDYIKNPKESGYRSYHLVYIYHSDSKEDYNRNMLIEIQFRTKLQHLWATAVETMGIYTNQSLKSGEGDDLINRFFTLVSTLFAFEEKTTVVSNAPDEKIAVIKEIKSILHKNNYLDTIKAIKVASGSQLIKSKEKEDGYFLLILNYSERMLHLEYFRPSEIEKASEKYNKTESENNDELDIVLVRAESFSSLKKAYPNYFTDITEFINKVEKIIK